MHNELSRDGTLISQKRPGHPQEARGVWLLINKKIPDSGREEAVPHR